MITNFLYNDIVLYAKGWYEKRDIIGDLGYLISQIHYNYPKTEKELAPYMLMVLDKLNNEMGGNKHGYLWFFNEVQKRIDIMYVSQEMAIIYVVLNELMSLSKDEIKLNPPHYGKKEHFRMGGTFGNYPISMTYTEMNRIAKKMFG